jgi:histidinol-phosphate aminotransferase
VLRLLDLRGVATAELAGRLPRPEVAGDGPVAAVRDILAAVRERGDAAVRELTARFDGVELAALHVPRVEWEAAAARIEPDLLVALEVAAANVRAFQEAERAPDVTHTADGIRTATLRRAVDRAGCYVPGGRATYPSTVLMTVVPAKVAGVTHVAVCVPPGPDGRVPDVVLAAALVAGADAVHPVGGAQAIAALAYGTASIPAVDVIVGPGNAYVAIAKREVAGEGRVGIPSAFAGPSEVVVVADGSVDPTWAAIDVIVQAEHGPDGLAWLVAWDVDALDSATREVDRLAAASPRRDEIAATLATAGIAVLVDDPAAAVTVANAIAPEHLELLCAGAEAMVDGVRHAGAVFCGPWSPAALGDYLAGPSHVLPTNGSARFGGALTPDDFTKSVHVVTATRAGFEAAAPHVIALAEAEGLEAHAYAVRLRLDGARGRSPREAMGIPAPRSDIALMAGYHSPQVEVAVRLNTNEAPEPPPPAFAAALAAAVARVDWHRYPDRGAGRLRAAIARHHRVDPTWVFAANGSNEVLQTICLAYGGPGRSVAVFEPTYALHSHIARITSTAVAVGERSDGGPGGGAFALDIAEVRRVFDEATPAITFLCSPNNPTGTVDPPEVLAEVLAAAPGLVVVDEAYGQFAPRSAVDDVQAGCPLVVSRTFSKTWSMAGARLGYCVGAPDVIEALDKVVLPYHLDAAKQLAGEIALDFEPEMRARVAHLVEERGRLVGALGDLPVDVYPSGANFVLFRPRHRTGPEVWQGLLDRSVLVRDCSSWPRLEGCLRVTVGTTDEDDAFLAALRDVLI